MNTTYKKTKDTTTCFGCWTNMDCEKAHQQVGGCLSVYDSDTKESKMMGSITCYGCIISDDMSEPSHEGKGGCHNKEYIELLKSGVNTDGITCYGCKIDDTNEYSHLGVGGCAVVYIEDDENVNENEKNMLGGWTTCTGCLYDKLGQLSHMNEGGCLYQYQLGYK